MASDGDYQVVITYPEKIKFVLTSQQYHDSMIDHLIATLVIFCFYCLSSSIYIYYTIYIFDYLKSEGESDDLIHVIFVADINSFIINDAVYHIY